VRSLEELRERIRMSLVEDMNALPAVMKEPENQFPEFLERLTNHLYEICVDEITFRRK
jgi:hypothetical protein